MNRRSARLALSLATLTLGVGALVSTACSKKEEPPKTTTALEDVQKIGDDAVKASNETNEKK